MSCGKVVNDFAKLPQAEKDALILLGYNKCYAGSDADFKNFKDTSDNAFNTFVRGQNWLYEMKNGSVVVDALRFTVWKALTNAVVFLVTSEKPGVPNTYSYLKVEDATNLEMI